MEAAVVAWLMQHDDRDPNTYLADLLRRPAWMADAACKDHPTELFFPGRGDSSTEARAICATCPVSAECLEYSIASCGSANDVGIWGGTSARQRLKIRRAMEKATKPLFCVVQSCGRPVKYGERCIACHVYRRRHKEDRPLEMVEAQNARDAERIEAAGRMCSGDAGGIRPFRRAPPSSRWTPATTS